MEFHREARTAPFYSVPPRRLVSVEHPAVIRNIEKAVDTLQGNAGIQKILHPPRPDTSANLILRPEDAMARPVHSTSVPSNNVLLRVTVPKRTGRKRKRGSDEPFTGPESQDASGQPRRRPAKDLLRSLQDNPSKYTVDPVGRVERTHVFRALPDFAYSTTNSSFTNRFRELIIPYDLEKLKQFDIEMAKGASTNADIIPPSSFGQHDVPFQYMYRQNPTVKQAVGQYGEVLTVNTSQPTPIRSHLVPYDVSIVPSEPEADLAPLETLELNLRDLIELLRGLFEQRPAWTRRGLRNHLKSDDQRTLLRHAIPYVGYIFRSGPWRDAIIKFGIDPRTSPEYRHYQTFMYRILPREVELARESGTRRRHNIPRPEEDVEFAGGASDLRALSDTHIFTGQVPLPRDGRIWMAIDIKDPILANILYPPNAPPDFLRPECEIIADGWFGNGTLAKVKTIMRAKIQALIEDRTPSDEEFACILPFPDHALSEADIVHFTLDPAVASSKEITLATEVRASIKGAPMWRKKHERERFGMDGVVGPGPGRGGPRQRGKAAVRFEEGALEGEGEGEEDGNGAEEESEGEEEERERAEMLEAQVAAAVAVEDAEDEGDEDEEGEEDNENGEDDEEEEDESDGIP